jgi:hypothetical protein
MIASITLLVNVEDLLDALDLEVIEELDEEYDVEFDVDEDGTVWFYDEEVDEWVTYDDEEDEVEY